MENTIQVGPRLLTITSGDITRERVDAIVNAANPHLAGGGGVDGAIHRAAGPELMDACRALQSDDRGIRCPVGGAVITPGFALAATWIIHTAGPIWQGGDEGEEEDLASSIRSCLALAADERLATVSLPAISCGIYGFPVKRGAAIMLGEARRALEKESSLKRVRFVLFGIKEFRAFSDALAALENSA